MLLPMGRLGDMYGGYLVYNAGLLWFFLWALIAGFSKNYMMLIFCRALQGLGPAAYLPGGVMLMGKIYRPGPRKNLVFALYGSFAPLGRSSDVSKTHRIPLILVKGSSWVSLLEVYLQSSLIGGGTFGLVLSSLPLCVESHWSPSPSTTAIERSISPWTGGELERSCRAFS